MPISGTWVFWNRTGGMESVEVFPNIEFMAELAGLGAKRSLSKADVALLPLVKVLANEGEGLPAAEIPMSEEAGLATFEYGLLTCCDK